MNIVMFAMGYDYHLENPASLSLEDVFTMATPHESSESQPAVATVDVTAANHLLRSAGHRYLDVRTEEEFGEGYLENSLNVPYMFSTPQGREKNPLFVEQVASLFSNEQNVVVGCQSGKRSELACTDLMAAGFKNVQNMAGGYAAWLMKGFAVQKQPDAHQHL